MGKRVVERGRVVETLRRHLPETKSQRPTPVSWPLLSFPVLVAGAFRDEFSDGWQCRGVTVGCQNAKCGHTKRRWDILSGREKLSRLSEYGHPSISVVELAAGVLESSLQVPPCANRRIGVANDEKQLTHPGPPRNRFFPYLVLESCLDDQRYLRFQHQLHRGEKQLSHSPVRIGRKLVVSDAECTDESFLDSIPTQHRHMEQVGELLRQCRLPRSRLAGNDHTFRPWVHSSAQRDCRKTQFCRETAEASGTIDDFWWVLQNPAFGGGSGGSIANRRQ